MRVMFCITASCIEGKIRDKFFLGSSFGFMYRGRELDETVPLMVLHGMLGA